MHRYLSSEWINAMDAALAGDDGLQASTADVQLTVQHVVDEVPPDLSTVSYQLRFDRGTTRVVAGTDLPADATFTCDYVTAAGIARGVERAQTAFMAGRLRMGGDARILLDHQQALQGVEDVTAAVRAATDFGDA